ncbi:MAG: glutamyl-tRNA reductase [Thermoplasmata archaeon]
MFLVSVVASYREMDLLSLEKWTSLNDDLIINNFKNSFKEILILRTCNRLEIYIVPKNDPTEDIKKLFEKYGEAKVLYDMDAVRHIIKVSSGMDSMIPGEQDVQRQVKEALNNSMKNHTSGKIINYIFMKSLNISKIIRSETMIGNGIVSIPQAAVKILEDFTKNGKICIIGTGKVAHSLLKYLSDKEYEITVFGRNKEKLDLIKREYKVHIDFIENLRNRIHEYDALISAISIQAPFLKNDNFNLPKPYIVMDLGNPRNIEKLNDREYIDLDYIKNFVNKNITRRKEEMLKAEKIIEEKLPQIENKILSLEIEEIISDMFKRGEKIRDEEIKKAIKYLGENSREILQIYGNSIIKRIYLNIIKNLKSQEKYLKNEDLEFLKKIFGD